ncbi:MAG: ABC transporter ATP-binding protein [Bacteroidia bacterium]
MHVLQTLNLHKQYSRVTAVNKLNLEIKRGSVFGLLGPNGSGKTTTLGMILGVTTPTDGEFKWFEEKGNHHHRKRIGAILEKPNFYPSFTAYTNLKTVCKIKDVPEKRIDEVLEQVGLLERKDDPFKTYSLGMKQRLAIGSALLANPDVLILDEPTNGLDPQGIAEIRQLIIDIAQSDKTIILASHLLDEVQKVCTDFAVLKTGNLIYTGKVDEGFGNETILEVGSDDLETLAEAVQQYPHYQQHRLLKDRLEITCSMDAGTASLNQFLAERSIYANHLFFVKKNLEQQFLEILSQHA